jgi:hypothetical protein
MAVKFDTRAIHVKIFVPTGQNTEKSLGTGIFVYDIKGDGSGNLVTPLNIPDEITTVRLVSVLGILLPFSGSFTIVEKWGKTSRNRANTYRLSKNS